MYNINGLQKICDALIENPSWSIAHLTAFFNSTEHINNPKMVDLIDYPDHVTLMTPLQVSILPIAASALMCCQLIVLTKESSIHSMSTKCLYYINTGIS